MYVPLRPLFAVLLQAALSLWWSSAVWAHEVRPAYLEIRETGPSRYAVTWRVPARGDDLRLGLGVHLPAKCVTEGELTSYFVAAAHTQQWHTRCAGPLAGNNIGIDGLSATMTDVLVRIEHGDGAVQTERVLPARPMFIVKARPGTRDVATSYFTLGVEHILTGIDHLLFVLSLLLIVQGARRLVATITAFTLAHSLTLVGATLGLVHVPSAPVEACIALSILFVAAEVVHQKRGVTGLTGRYPWIVAFLFGLLHGFGFASALGAVGLPQGAIPMALLFFNLGVEAGQLAFIVSVLYFIAVWQILTCRPKLRQRMGALTPARVKLACAYGIGAIAAYWGIERTAGFWS